MIEEERKLLLQSYFTSNGMLLCNESKELPYLESVGGSWNSIVTLIEEGNVFYSKLYHGRVTYLSRALYANVKPYKQRLERLSPTARSIYDFLAQGGMASTEELKALLHLSGKTFAQSMDVLFEELLVTAIKRETTKNENWCSFYWGTYETWEAMHSIEGITVSDEMLRSQTKNLLTERKLQNLLK